MRYIYWLSTDTPLSPADRDILQLIGGKNAALATLLRLSTQGPFQAPDGFAITTAGYWHYLESQDIKIIIERLVSNLVDFDDIAHVEKISASIQALIAATPLPQDLCDEITQAYTILSQRYGVQAVDVAVRSSALYEDAPGVSAAGQHDSFLAIQSRESLLDACKKCFASLFSPRALIYRAQSVYALNVTENGSKNSSFLPAISVGVQKMVRADAATAGVAFSLETESGCKNFITIAASYGLGQLVVQGAIIPDEFYVHKQKLAEQYTAVVYKRCGSKENKLVYAQDVYNGQLYSSQQALLELPVSCAERTVFSLHNQQVLAIARAVLFLENYYQKMLGRECFLDVEWAYDGVDNKLYIVQVRPETVYSSLTTGHTTTARATSAYTYSLATTTQEHCTRVLLAKGQAVGKKIVHGTARVIAALDTSKEFNKGDILVAAMTDPDWMPLLQKAGGVITNSGGRTCHAAIVSRELGIPALVGTHTAVQTIASGNTVTLDCSQGLDGFVYDGAVPFTQTPLDVRFEEYTPPVDLFINLADPAQACAYASLPVAGVGLARLEFIIANLIGIHPLAIAHYDQLEDYELKRVIKERSKAYSSPQEFFIQTLAQGIGLIAAAFYPRPVIIRLTDFKTNEYAGLLGGNLFEEHEENPMLGFRGAARYTSLKYRPAFKLECAALTQVRTVMGLDNTIIMVPFVRTTKEAQSVLDLLELYNLKRGAGGLKIYMMVELPANVLLIEQFAHFFDGLSIGSNDLTQLTLGVDRDSAVLAPLFDERDQAVKAMLAYAVEGARRAHKPIGICGQAPSDYPEMLDFLLALKINSLSLNPDAVFSCLSRLKELT